MQNIAFDPKDVTVKVGQKVTLDQRRLGRPQRHGRRPARDFKSDNFGKGATFSFTPTKAGTINYVCTIHPGMTATLTVTK